MSSRQFLFALWVAAAFLAAPLPAMPPLLVPGDETIVVTRHEIRTPAGPLRYEARAGRLPI
ncbi:MAG: hypothetical protein ACXWUP_10855, partial [Allosphingosinicella sp.]